MFSSYHKYFYFLCFLFCSIGVFSQYSLNGDAIVTGPDCYSITQGNSNFQNGSVWYDQTINLQEDIDFQLIMNFGSNDFEGADGMVFVLHQQGANALGDDGLGMGFQGFAPSLGIEFDTFQNNELGDPFDDHIAIHRDGNVNHFGAQNLAGPVNVSSLGPNIEDGLDHLVRIRWQVDEQLLQVFFDCELRLSINEDIINNIFFGNPEVTFGFTGATGAFTNEQTVCLDNQILGLQEEYAICLGDAVELSVNALVGGDYEWSPDLNLSANDQAEVLASPTEDTEYTVTYTDQCGNQKEESTLVRVFTPEVDLGEDMELCSDQSLNFSISPDPELNYLWNTGTVGFEETLFPGESYWLEAEINGCLARDSIEVIELIVPDLDLGEDISACEGEVVIIEPPLENFSITWQGNIEADSYFVEESETVTAVAVDSGNGCSANDEIQVSFQPLPEVLIPELVEACEGDIVLLTSTGEADEFNWSNGSSEAEILVDESGLYILESSLGNCSTLDSTLVTIYQNPQPNLGENILACEGIPLEFDLIEEGFRYFWNEQEGGPSFTFLADGLLNLTVIDTATLCVGGDEVFIERFDIPELIAPSYLQICPEEELEITLEIFGADSLLINDLQVEIEDEGEYEWSPNQSGEYLLEATNECGSSFVLTQVEAVNCQCAFYIPNTFTPDGDGLNEVFKVIPDCEYEDFNFRIFNRWGEKVFETNSPAIPWQGDESSGDYFVSDGLYVWQLSYKTFLFDEIQSVEKSGHITILR